MTAATRHTCGTCEDNLWVADENWQPEPHELGRPRTPGAGLIPCGACNEGNWESPQPYAGWPGECREFVCDDAVHPCALFHDPTACDRVPAPGCGCDFEPHAEPVDEAPFCEHPYCHARVHLDPVHIDEHGRPFSGGTPSDPMHWPADEPVTPPYGIPLTPIHDQLVAERTYPELNP